MSPVMGTARNTAGGPRPPLADRLTPAQWLAVDAAAAVLVALWVVFDLRLRHGFRFELPEAWFGALGAAVTLPVAVRRIWPARCSRRRPRPALPALIVRDGRVPTYLLIVMRCMAVYTTAVRCRRKVAVAALPAPWSRSRSAPRCWPPWPSGLERGGRGPQPAGGRVAVVHRRQRAGAPPVPARPGRAGRPAAPGRDRAGRQAVREERIRIARELHDVVAHSLSVVTVQARVGRRIGATRPAEALLALRAVEVTGRGALEELRRILGLLRDDHAEAPSLVPAPGIGDLGELAPTVRAAGIPVALAVTGEVAALPPAASLTVYRIVQEALTNVVKHAPGAQATVRVQACRDGVLITVGNGRGTGGPASSPSEGARHGIVGMRERAAAFGGTLDAGPVAGGGFQVTAFLPVPCHGQAAPVGQVA